MNKIPENVVRKIYKCVLVGPLNIEVSNDVISLVDGKMNRQYEFYLDNGKDRWLVPVRRKK